MAINCQVTARDAAVDARDGVARRKLGLPGSNAVRLLVDRPPSFAEAGAAFLVHPHTDYVVFCVYATSVREVRAPKP